MFGFVKAVVPGPSWLTEPVSASSGMDSFEICRNFASLFRLLEYSIAQPSILALPTTPRRQTAAATSPAISKTNVPGSGTAAMPAPAEPRVRGARRVTVRLDDAGRIDRRCALDRTADKSGRGIENQSSAGSDAQSAVGNGARRPAR